MTTADQSQTAPPIVNQGITTPRRRPRTLIQQQRFWGWVFLSPWIVGFIIFYAMPIIASFLFTFAEFNLDNGTIRLFDGAHLFTNWQKLFTDPLIFTTLGVTFRFALVAIPIGIVMPLGLAALLNSKYLWGKRIWRTLFYMPYMVPSVSAVFIWLSFLNGQDGWLNRVLRLIGIADPPNWARDPNFMMFAFIFIGFWGVGNAMLTMLATMQGVPTELYEAADVDGAGAWTKFRKITVPLISPVIFYNLVLSVIGLMQYFNVPYIATNGTGDPNHAGYFINFYLYKTAFGYHDMGYGATQAWLIFIIALILTIGLFATSRRWVYYASGD